MVNPQKKNLPLGKFWKTKCVYEVCEIWNCSHSSVIVTDRSLQWPDGVLADLFKGPGDLFTYRFNWSVTLCPMSPWADGAGGRWMVFLVELRGGVASWAQVHLRDHLGDLLRVAQRWSTVSLGIVWLFTAATSLWRFLDFFAVWHNLFAILFTGSGWSLEGKIFCSNLLCACAYACVRNGERELESCLANALIRH